MVEKRIKIPYECSTALSEPCCNYENMVAYFLNSTGMIILIATGLPSWVAGSQSGDEDTVLTASSMSFWSAPPPIVDTFAILPVSVTVNVT